MNLVVRFAFSLVLAAPLVGQVIIDTVGGTTSAPARAALAKANVFRVDKSVLLLDYEMYLNIPASETLTWFLYRHHSKDGTYTKDWTKTVVVNGTGLGWYSTGVISLPLVAGNHYQLGVSWLGTLTYHYITATSGQPVSFGAWHRGTTPTGLPATFTISGVDIAQYYQRLRTLPMSSVVNVGTPCTSATSPRLVAALPPLTGGKLSLSVVEAAASAPALLLLSVGGGTLTTPIPVLGCSFWLAPAPILDVLLSTSTTGEAHLVLPIPADNALKNLMLSSQAGVAGPALSLTNAVRLTIG